MSSSSGFEGRVNGPLKRSSFFPILRSENLHNDVRSFSDFKGSHPPGPPKALFASWGGTTGLPVAGVAILVAGSGGMHSGQVQFVNNARCRTADAGRLADGVRVLRSDTSASPAAGLSRCGGSIREDFRVPFLPNCTGRRQTLQADPRGAKIPCPRRPYNRRHFFLCNQSVAAKMKDGARQLKFIYGSLESGGGAMATLANFCASLLYGVFSENLFRPKMPSPWLTPEV